MIDPDELLATRGWPGLMSGTARQFQAAAPGLQLPVVALVGYYVAQDLPFAARRALMAWDYIRLGCAPAAVECGRYYFGGQPNYTVDVKDLTCDCDTFRGGAPCMHIMTVLLLHGLELFQGLDELPQAAHYDWNARDQSNFTLLPDPQRLAMLVLLAVALIERRPERIQATLDGVRTYRRRMDDLNQMAMIPDHPVPLSSPFVLGHTWSESVVADLMDLVPRD